MGADCHNFDAAVVGGGPAGALTAYHLARAGVKVLLVDANRFPREKACGGGIQQRASRRIPMEWATTVHEQLHEVHFSLGMRKSFTRQSGNTLVSSVLRTEFDDYLLTQAKNAGAVIWEDCKANSIEECADSHVKLGTARGSVRARFAIGADGANSIVARYLNPRSAYFWQLALYCEVPEKHLLPGAIRASRMRIDWGTLPSGYAWVFPKQETANIGVGAPAILGRALRPYLQRFLRSEGILKEGALEQLPLRGHHLPTLTKRTRLSSDASVLVGDAAGLVEPLTGEGISNACHSAEIASEYLLGRLNGETQMESYDHRIRREIGSEITHARELLSLAVAFPTLLFRTFKSNDAVWETFCNVLQGIESFDHLRKVIMGDLDSLWQPVHRFSCLCERTRLLVHRYLRAHWGEARPSVVHP
jgi:geranylgeranyl reductase family protein